MKSANRVVDPILTQLGLEYRQAQTNFIADRVAPWVRTEGSTGTYFIADALNNLGVEDNTWSATAGAKSVDSVFTSAAFKAQPYGLQEPVPDAFVRDWLAGGDDLKRRATTGLQDKMLLAREVRVEALFDAVAPTTSLTSTACWDSTAPNPRADVQAVMGPAIMKRVGKNLNAVVMTAAVWRSVIGTHSAGTAGALILDAIKYTRPGLGSSITPDLVAQYLNVDFVFPAISVRNATTDIETTTANAGGLAAAGIDLWDAKEIYGIIVDSNPGPQSLSFMLTFGPDKGTIDQYRKDEIMADVVRCTETLVEKVVCSNAIYTLGTVVS